MDIVVVVGLKETAIDAAREVTMDWDLLWPTL
jgi:hypothetical protein